MIGGRRPATAPIRTRESLPPPALLRVAAIVRLLGVEQPEFDGIECSFGVISPFCQ
jgi:hypothetical protein